MFNGKKDITAKGGAAFDNSGIGNNASIFLNNAAKLPSVINPLIEKIIAEEERLDAFEPNEVPDIEDKIAFNSVKVYAEDLRESAGYMSLIEELIHAIDDEKPSAKKFFLKAIKRNYDNHKKALLVENTVDPSDPEHVQKLICENADKLIQLVAQTMLEHASSHVDHSVELVQAAQELVVGYGFINCKILEKPQ